MKTSVMLQWSARFAFILCAVFLLSSCQKDKKEDQGTVTEPIKAPIAIAFLDATPPVNKNVKNVKITLIDPEGLIVSSSGTTFTSLTLMEGIMSLGLKARSRTIIDKEPYRFWIKSEADGYVESIITILLTDEKPRYVPVFMANISTPPPGISAFVQTIPITSTGVIANALDITTPQTKDLKNQLKITIKAGTQLLCAASPRDEDAKGDDKNENGYNKNKMQINPTDSIPCLKDTPNPPTKVEVSLSYGNPSFVESSRTFPGGFLVTDALDGANALATPRQPFYFATLGWTTLNMKIGGLEIVGFSQPLVGEMPIEQGTINPNTNVAFKVGDKVPMWSMNENTGVWVKEQEGSVIANNVGALIATFAIKHLSTWNVDYTVSACPFDPPIVVSYNIASGATNQNHYSELIHTQSCGIFMHPLELIITDCHKSS